jgi:hypothetical protein
MARQHTIPWNKVWAIPSILHTVGVNWNSHSEIDTAYTGKCDVALNNKQVLRKCLKALDKEDGWNSAHFVPRYGVLSCHIVQTFFNNKKSKLT